MPLGPLTLIVGTNGSGKSNLRDTLRVLHGVGLGYPLAEILGDKYGPGGILQWRGIRGGAREAAYHGRKTFRVRAALRVPQDAPGRSSRRFLYRLTVDVSDMRTGPRVTAESLHRIQKPSPRFPVFELSGDYLFHSHPEDDPLEQRGEHQIRVRHPRGGKYRKHGKVSELASSSPVLSQLADSAAEAPTLRKACSAVLEVFRSIRFLDLDPDAMRHPSQPGQVILGDRGENLSSVLQAICAETRCRRGATAR